MNININIKDKLKEGHMKLLELLNSNNWIDKKIVDKIDSKIMSQNSLIPIVYCKSIIRCPPKELFDYLVHNISSTLHEFKTDDNIIAKVSTIISTGYPANDREDVYINICDKNEDSYFELSFGIDENIFPLNVSNKAINPNKLVRSDMHFAAKKITFHEEGCEYITIWHYDPMGWLSKFIPRKILGNIILKNLVHEHEKLHMIFNNSIQSNYSFMNSIISSFINLKYIIKLILLFFIIVYSYNIVPINVSYLFLNNMFWSFILFIGCLISPKLMIRINSVPWAFHPIYNTDITYQTVLYIALHEKSINLLSHLTIATDSIFWFIILLNMNYIVFPLFITLLLVQAYYIYRKTPSFLFIILLLLSWLTSITCAYNIAEYIGWDLMEQVSIIFISISAFMRVITHSVEQIPPGVASILYIDNKPKYDVFKKYKEKNLTLEKKSWLLMCFLQGYIAEFISSLPCRLFIVHVFYLADMIGINIPSIGSWKKLTEQAIAIRNNGWKASYYTKWMSNWLDTIM